MASDSGYEKGNYLRVCDICGHRFHFRDLKPIGELRFACPDDAPGLTSMQVSRFNARAKPLVVKPNRWAKDYAQTGIYQLAEAQIFNFIAKTAPANVSDGASDPLAAAWAAIYMADLVSQAKRPAAWSRTALAVIGRCLTYLLTRQYGSPTGTAGTADNPRYGGILGDTNYSTKFTIAAGVAFLKAYTATGIRPYLDAADRCAVYLRHVQCGDLQVSAYTVYPSGGGAYHLGGLASGVVDATGLLATTYLTADVAGLWFLSLLADARGATTAYGDAASTAFFTAPTTATLATMMSELTAFGETGPRDSTTGALTPGLSTTAPRATYQAAVNGVTGGATWTTIGTIPSDDICMAVLGLYMANGNDPKVQAMMTWLGAFTSNTNNQTPAGMPEPQVIAGITGTYDPAIAPASALQAAAPFTEADQAVYSWASEGLLSPILSSTSPAAYRTSKDAVSTSRQEVYGDPTNKWLGPLGGSGLSFQPRTRRSLISSLGAGSFGDIVTGIGSDPSSPSVPGLRYWFEADRGVTKNVSLQVSDWVDQTGHGWDLHTPSGGNTPPTYVANSLNGLPGLYFGNPIGGGPGDWSLAHYGGPFYAGAPAAFAAGTAYPFEQNEPHILYAVVKVQAGAPPGGGVAGGMIAADRKDFSRQLWTLGANQQRVARNAGLALLYQDPAVDYVNTPLLITYRWDGTNMYVSVNGGAALTTIDLLSALTTKAFPAVADDANNHVLMVGGSSTDQTGFKGPIYAVLLEAATVPSNTILRYLAHKWAFPTDSLFTGGGVVAAAKTGMMYRYDPGRYPALRGN